MGVDGGVSGSSCELFAVFVRDVLSYVFMKMVTILNVLLGESQVDHIDDRLALAPAHQKIIRFDIPMQKVSIMQKFDSLE